MEKLIEKLKDMISKETDYAVRAGLQRALIEVYEAYSEELNKDIMNSIKKFN